MLRTSRELVAKVKNMFKNKCDFFRQNISLDCPTTVARRSCECREPVSAKFLQIYNAKFSRQSLECHASVARRSRDSLETICESLATIWRENKTKRHSNECRATLTRMPRNCRTNLNENKLHSRESREPLSRMSCDCLATVARQSRDMFSKLERNSLICRINVYSMRMQHESCVYIVNLCREIIASYSRTSLQLSHSSEIGEIVLIGYNVIIDVPFI